MDSDIASAPPRSKPPPRTRLLTRALVLLVTLAIGGAASLWIASEAGWIAWRGWPWQPASAPPAATVAAPLPPAVAAPGDEPAQVALAVRIGELEQRIARLDLQTETAEGNAARAEGLMIAFAARRAIERGLALGYLENQLRLRFGDAQPNAVAMLIEAGSRPVTRDQLVAGLNAIAPRLAEPAPSESAWERLRRELAGLVVLRKASTPSPAPQRRLERAEQALASGRVEAAIAEVERLPNRAAAAEWLTQAQRFLMAQRSLDLIETAALMEPRPPQRALSEASTLPPAAPAAAAPPNRPSPRQPSPPQPSPTPPAA